MSRRAWDLFLSRQRTTCPACDGTKRAGSGVCASCWKQLPLRTQSDLWARIDSKAYARAITEACEQIKGAKHESKN